MRKIYGYFLIWLGCSLFLAMGFWFLALASSTVDASRLFSFSLALRLLALGGFLSFVAVAGGGSLSIGYDLIYKKTASDEQSGRP